eukprot:5233480-Pyramimonas_sp.AAC.1
MGYFEAALARFHGDFSRIPCGAGSRTQTRPKSSDDGVGNGSHGVTKCSKTRGDVITTRTRLVLARQPSNRPGPRIRDSNK